MNYNEAQKEMQSKGAPLEVMGYCKIAFDLASPRWIPVTESLPDSDTTVMTFAPDSNEPIWPAYLDCEGDKDVWMDLMGAPITDALITHWMPFPEPRPEANHVRPCLD